MSDELQAGEQVTQEIVEPVEPVSESAPDSGENHEQNNDASLNLDTQEKVQKRINSITAQKYDLQRENDELRKKLEANAQPAPPVTPAQSEAIAPPDTDLQYEDPEAYNAQMVRFHQSVAEKTARETLERDRQAQLNAQRQQQQQNANAELQRDYQKKAANTGVDLEVAFQAAQTLQQRGAPPELQSMLVKHDKAPLIMDYLARNPADYDDIASVAHNPYATLDKIKEIESKAVTRNISSAPQPEPTLTGLSAKEPDEFEARFGGRATIL